MAQAIPFVVSGLQAIGGGSAATGAALAASTAAAVGGTAASLNSQRKSQAANEKAEAASRATSAIENQRKIRQNLLRTRVAQAQTTAAGFAQGSGFGSSGIQGANASVATQGAANQGNLNTQMAGNSAIQRNLSQSRGFQGDAATFGAIAALPGQFGFGMGDLMKQRTDNLNA